MLANSPMSDNLENNPSETIPIDQLISVHQAATLANLSASHLRLLVRTGRVQGQKLGRDWFTTPAAIAAYVAISHRPGPKPKRD
jgi:hypothetical protein